MLPKKRRISRKEFPHILSTGKRFNSQSLLLYLALDKTNILSRFSFSLSKKTCALATERNKYRRQGYSLITENLKRIKPGFLLFFSFKKGSLPISYDKLRAEVEELLSNSGVII
ncbi:ribonuclease P protein component [Patescibacteria group bacterium]|nr:ribonuclease P protein component [Patescibacteria group bacterium]